MKYFRMSWDEIMHERSWANICMLMATIPDHSVDNESDGLSPAARMANSLMQQ